VVSARWVVPIERPPIAEGALALADNGTILAVGSRAELRAEFPDVAEQRAEGVLLPGLVNAHCHLELSLHAHAVPGGHGVYDWAMTLMRTHAGQPPERVRDAAVAAAAAAAAMGTAAIGDVGNSLQAVPGIIGAGLAGVMFHELLGSREAATGDALADAAREWSETLALVGSDWPERVDYIPAPHAPYSAGPELLTRIFTKATNFQHTTSIHVTENENEIALLRNNSNR